MQLAKHEIELAERHIAKREKQLAQWPVKRWVILVLFTVSAFIGYRNVADGTRGIQDDRATDLQLRQSLEKTPPPGLEYRWAVGSMLKVSKILELRHQVVSYSLMQIGLGYVQLLLGITMITIVVLRWEPNARDALICKLLRWQLEELKPRAAPNNPPSAQSPASPEIQPSGSPPTHPAGS